MKITRLETIWIDEQPNTMWLRIHTDEGLIGLGETFYVPRAVSAVIHDVFATLLLGRSPFDIERHSKEDAGRPGMSRPDGTGRPPEASRSGSTNTRNWPPS